MSDVPREPRPAPPTLQHIEDSFFEGKRPSPPLFIVTYGPPGSGKSELVRDLLARFNISERRVVSVLVDDVVERLPGYLDEVRAVASDASLSDADRQKELTSVYFKYRRSAGDVLSDAVLHRAFVGRYNIVWETTGDNVDWAVKTVLEAKAQGYAVVMVYPYVSEANLLRRVDARARSGDNPRRPDEKRVRDNVVNAQRNLARMSTVVDRVFVYDNDGRREELAVMVDVERRHQGWCPRDDKNCDKGVVEHAKCNDAAIGARRSTFDAGFGEYIDRVCGRKH